MEDTTTDAVLDQGVQSTQPEVSETPAEAVDTTTDAPQQDSANEPSQEDDNSKWLASKGIDPTDPEAINKLAKSAREAERMATQKAQKASELERSMAELSDQSAEEVAYSTGQDPELLKRLQRFEVKSAIRDFFDVHPDAKQYEQEMVKNMLEGGLYGTPEAMLRAAYAMAASEATTDRTSIQRQTLENLAQKQAASVPRGNATNAAVTSSQNKITAQNVDQLVASNSLEWFKKNYDAINKALSEQ